MLVIVWGCYLMVLWVGCIWYGSFIFDGRCCLLFVNFDVYVIYGVGFIWLWYIDSFDVDIVRLLLVLFEDDYWLFGGRVIQIFYLQLDCLYFYFFVEVGYQVMFVVIGWYLWFCKLDCLQFVFGMMYLWDYEGIVILLCVSLVFGLWDDCFINQVDVLFVFVGQQLWIWVDVDYWVIYDGVLYVICVELQMGLFDGFMLVLN